MMKLFKTLLMILFFATFSQAQHMFYHLLPGFTPAFVWVGLGGDANWNTPENWSTESVPGASDTATFDDTCISNCDPLMNVAINVRGINMKNTYAGTITQNSGMTITVGLSGWTQAGGIFVGSDATISMSGPFALSAGTFTAPNTTWTHGSNFSITGGTFNHNSVAMIFNQTSTIIGGGRTFNDVTFTGVYRSFDLGANSMIVNGDLVLNDVHGASSAPLSNGTIEARANVTVLNQGKTGNAVIKINGGGAQTLTGVNTGWVPGIEIDKAAGTLTISGTVRSTSNWTQTNGVVDTTGSTIAFEETSTITPGSVNYNNIVFTGSYRSFNLNAGTMIVLGTLYLSDIHGSSAAPIDNGTIEARSHVEITNQGKIGTVIVKINGAGAQTLTGVNTGWISNVEINKAGGTLTLAGTIRSRGNWNWQAGTVDATGSTLSFEETSTLTPGPVNYNNVSFIGDHKIFDLNAGTMAVTGTLTCLDINASGGGINNGTLNASGNVVFSNYGKRGSALLNFIGTTATNLTIGASSYTLDTTNIVAKTGAGSVTLTGNASYFATGKNFTISTGTFNVAGFTFSVNSLLTISVGGRLLCNGGTATAGSWSILGEISCGTGQGITWTGLGGDNLWSTATNWTNNTVPGASDLARFNNSVCVGASCNAQINSNLSVRGINLQSTYTGTLTQNATRTLTVGTAGYSQAAGTFAGGDSTITMNGIFDLSGGTFTATSGSWSQTANMTISGIPTFNHNGGSWSTSQAITITPNSISLYNASFGGCATIQSLNSGTINIEGQLNLNDGCGPSNNINSGTINAKGNVVASNSGKLGSAVIIINGTGNQTLNGNGSYIPGLTINKPSGTLTVLNSTNITGNYAYVAGTVDIGTSSFYFPYAVTITPGALEYNNVGFGGCGFAQNLNSGTMIVNGTVFMYDGCGPTNQVNSGTIEARGNISYTNSGKSGTALILINGTGNQTLSGVLGGGPHVGNIQINKASGTLTVTNTLDVKGSWTYTAGTVDMGTSTINFTSNNSITPGSVQYNNVGFGGCGIAQNLNSGTMIVNGSLGLMDSCSPSNNINSGTIEAKGNLNYSNSGKSGTATILINGTGNQSMTGAAGAPYIGNLNINKPSGTLTMSSNFRVIGTWTHTAGTVDPGTSTLIFPSTSTINVGSMEFYNVTFGTGCGVTTNLNAGSIIINGTTTINDTCGGGNNINNGNIYSRGNVDVSSSGKLGTALLYFSGNSSATLTWTAGSFLTATLEVAKTGGASLLLGATTSFSTAGRDLLVSSGTLDLNGNDLTVNDTLTISPGATLRCNGGEFTVGTLSALGTINCPGYSAYEFNWTGAGGDPNWSTAGNWQGGVAPTSTSVVAFQDSTCGGTCNSTIDTAATVRGVRIYSPFNGTISQSVGNAFTVGSRGWTQAAGNFIGSNANMTIGGRLNVTNGSLTATSALLRIGYGGICTTANIATISNTATFIHNSGTVNFSASGNWMCSPSAQVDLASNVNFHHVEIDGAYFNGAYPIPIEEVGGKTVSVTGNLTQISGGINGSWGLAGNLVIGANANGGSGEIIFNSAGTQTYSSGATGVTAGFTVNKSAGVVQPNAGTTDVRSAVFNLIAGSFTAPTGTMRVGRQITATMTIPIFTVNNGTTFTTNSGTIHLAAAGSWMVSPIATVAVPAGFAFDNVIVDGAYYNGAYPIPIRPDSGTLQVAGNISHVSAAMTNSWAVGGNYTVSGSAGGGAGTLTFNGAGVQTISRSAGTPIGGLITVNKSSGSVLLGSAINFGTANQDLTVTSGTIDMAGFNLTVARNISNSGTIQRGTNPLCGVVSQGGSFTGNAPICP